MCFILDDNAYVVISEEREFTGRFFGDIRPDIMYHLINNSVYKETIMFDYQAICHELPPTSNKESSAAVIITTFRKVAI